MRDKHITINSLIEEVIIEAVEEETTEVVIIEVATIEATEVVTIITTEVVVAAMKIEEVTNREEPMNQEKEVVMISHIKIEISDTKKINQLMISTLLRVVSNK